MSSFRWLMGCLVATTAIFGGGGIVQAVKPATGQPPTADRGSSPPDAMKARWSVTADDGFFDDAWALDAAGKRLAVVQTDRDNFQHLQIFQLDSTEARPVAKFDLPPPARALIAISFLPAGAGLVMVSGTPDAQVIEAVDETGKPLGKAGPVSSFAFTTRPGPASGTGSGGGGDSRAGGAGTGARHLMVTLDRRAGRNGEMSYVVTALRLPDLKAADRARTHQVRADGLLRAAPLVPVGFFDGFSKLLAERPGWYDKKKDVRQPDGQSVLDLLSGKIVADGPIEDVYGWARTKRLRREYPNRTAFVQVADPTALVGPSPAEPRNQAAGIELVDPAGRLVPLPLAVPFRLYDRLTLKDQEGPEPGTIHFGIQVDPVNPDAVARKKADPAFLDLYTVSFDRPAAASRWRARVALDAQPAVWSMAGDHLVVLRRFRSFARGGNRVDVYDLRP